jgi:hypothetical protein
VPRWVVQCPNCLQEFTHSEIDNAMLQEARFDPFGVVPKASGGKRTCPNCKVETDFKPNDLLYRQDARGQAS